MPLFVVILKFTDDRDHVLANRPAHREYLMSMLAQGKLVESGPFADDSGGMVIYEAEDRAAVEQILADDPYAPAGVVVHRDTYEWTRVFQRDA
ncbi:MAG: YciI family protein [Thermomicrobiales bacterium]